MVRGYTPDIAWRVLGSHHFGVAQKRRRIFLVADYHAERSAQILFEPDELQQVFPAGAPGRVSPAGGAGKNNDTAGWPPAIIRGLQNRKLRGAAQMRDKGQFYGSFGRPNDALPTLLTSDIQVIHVHFPEDPDAGYVRYLTPTEYERLMGLPEGWTEFGYDGKLISDTARYFGLGNSIVVPCAEFVMWGIQKALSG